MRREQWIKNARVTDSTYSTKIKPAPFQKAEVTATPKPKVSTMYNRIPPI